MMSEKSTLPVVLGAMTFGEEGKEQARVHDLKKVQEIIDIFKNYGHKEIDTARMYGAGTSEVYLGKLEIPKQGLQLSSKIFPFTPAQLGGIGGSATRAIRHTRADIREQLEISLKNLGVGKLKIWYLHAPDRETPFEETLKAVDELYREGKFEIFGISNYASWEVAELVTLARANGWVEPKVYQGVYNAIHRGIEPELIPALRKYGISFYAYNPLGGGFFTGKDYKMDSQVEAGSRFDPNRAQGKQYRARYWNQAYFDALEKVRPVVEKHGLTLGETAIRWISHHSALKREHGDSVIIGASSTNHIEENLKDFEKGPLPEEIVQVLDEAWEIAKPFANNYFR